jgi:hypothetical protein
MEHPDPASKLPGWNILILLASVRMEHPDPACKLSANLYDIYQCCVYSEKLLTTDRGTVRNMWSFLPNINLRN